MAWLRAARLLRGWRGSAWHQQICSTVGSTGIRGLKGGGHRKCKGSDLGEQLPPVGWGDIGRVWDCQTKRFGAGPMEQRPDLRKGLACHPAEGIEKNCVTRKPGPPAAPAVGKAQQERSWQCERGTGEACQRPRARGLCAAGSRGLARAAPPGHTDTCNPAQQSDVPI